MRKYSVLEFTWSEHNDKSMIGKPSRYAITDAETDEETKKSSALYRPFLAEFPVSLLYDAETAQQFAQKLCDYMNSRQEAMAKAIDDNALLQKIML